MNKEMHVKLIPHKNPKSGTAYAKLIHVIPKPLRKYIENIIFPKPNGNVFNEIFSLGNNCYSALLMKDLQIRKSSGPFDWIAGPTLFGRLDLISKRFNGFIDRKNLEYTNFEVPGENKIHVHNKKEQFTFVHDFSSKSIEEYDSICQKYKRRQERFLKKMRENELNCLLYVQSHTELEEPDREIANIMSATIKTKESIKAKNITLILCLQSTHTNKHVEMYRQNNCTIFIQRFNKKLIKKDKPILDCIVRETIRIAEENALL